MSNHIAPHQNDELNLVLSGYKPLASLTKSQNEQQFNLALTLTNVLSVSIFAKDHVTVAQIGNEANHQIFEQYMQNGAFDSPAEKHRAIGELLGYTEVEIDAFINAGNPCACGTCEWGG